MFPQELNYLNLIVLLTVVTLVLCALIAMCFKIKKLEKKLDYLTNQIKFERHVLQPPLRQSTILDSRSFNENQSVNIPIEMIENDFREENERIPRSSSNNKNVCFKESPNRVPTLTKNYNQETESEETDTESIPLKHIGQVETTSSDSDEANPYEYRSNHYYRNVNLNSRIKSPMKPLVELLRHKHASQRSTLPPCREEDSDSSTCTYNNEINHQKNLNCQVDRYLNQSGYTSKLKINGVDLNNKSYLIKHQTSYQNLFKHTKTTRGMKRSQSWDPNNNHLQLS